MESKGCSRQIRQTATEAFPVPFSHSTEIKIHIMETRGKDTKAN